MFVQYCIVYSWCETCYGKFIKWNSQPEQDGPRVDHLYVGGSWGDFLCWLRLLDFMLVLHLCIFMSFPHELDQISEYISMYYKYIYIYTYTYIFIHIYIYICKPHSILFFDRNSRGTYGRLTASLGRIGLGYERWMVSPFWTSQWRSTIAGAEDLWVNLYQREIPWNAMFYTMRSH